MKSFEYNFSTRIDFDKETSHQDFLLRAIPMSGSFQTLGYSSLTISGCDYYSTQIDSFGNQIQWGRISKPKSFFEFSSQGCVYQTKYLIAGTYNPIYLYNTPLTRANENMLAFLKSLNLDSADGTIVNVKKICDAVAEKITYKKASTTYQTKAYQAFDSEFGVCQDFAQIVISFCRLAKIPARYVNGLIMGEGESHAWIEVWDNFRWFAFDPTNDVQIDYGYIKISHGRDSADCALNKGVIACIANQNIVSTVKVFQKYD